MTRPPLDPGSAPSSTDPDPSAPSRGALSGRRVLLAVTGSIAAYKAVLLLRLLKKAGAHVEVLLTDTARRFVGAATFSGLGAPVHDDMFSAPGELHVTLGQRADVLLVAPATADVLARLRQGRADDLLTATALCLRGRLLLAPAMHPTMWHAPAVRENVALLQARGAELIGPVVGEVASGDSGMGRMAEPEEIVAALTHSLRSDASLGGRHVVVTAGPTREPIDPVRFLTNTSSGKMGFAIAAQAARRGARVTLIAGPVHQPTPAGVERLDVGTTEEMRSTLWSVLGDDLQGADALVMCAAVADYRPRTAAEHKLKRGDELRLDLVPNPDLLAEIGAARGGTTPVLVGFALETGDDDALSASARGKLQRKKVDLVVANAAAESLGRDDNRVLLVTDTETTPLPTLPKEAIAHQLLDWVGARLDALTAPPADVTPGPVDSSTEGTP